jgi:hypothetical protein
MSKERDHSGNMRVLFPDLREIPNLKEFRKRKIQAIKMHGAIYTVLIPTCRAHTSVEFLPIPL